MLLHKTIYSRLSTEESFNLIPYFHTHQDQATQIQETIQIFHF